MIKLKKVISINELVWGSLFLCLLICIVSFVLFKIYFNLIFTMLFLISIISSLFFMMYIHINSHKVWNRDLPLNCTRNPFGFIEIHIGKKCNHILVVLLNAFLETVYIAINEEKDILIDTWLISERNMRKYLEDSVEVLRIGPLQKWSNCFNKLKYSHKDKRKSYRYLIHTSKITDKHIEKIKDKIKEIENRDEKKKA